MGYDGFVEFFGQYEDPSRLLEAEDLDSNVFKIDNIETNDIEFVITYNFIKNLAEPMLDEIHTRNVARGDKGAEIAYQKQAIDSLLEDDYGYKLEGEGGYTLLEDGTMVVTKFTKESLRNSLYMLTNNYSSEKSK